MNKLLFVISLLAAGLILAGCASLSGPASINVTPALYDFGDIVQSNGTISTDVEVENVGGEPLEILKLSTSCGCTTAEMDTSDIAPGESRTMTITFDPMVHPDQFGPINRIVYLQTSDAKKTEFEINVIGNVIQGSSEEGSHDDDYGENEIGPISAKNLLQKNDSLTKVLDVRTHEEFNKERIPESLANSILLPHTEISTETLRENNLNTDDEIIIVCRSGRRAKIAYDLMEEMGYSNMKILAGGLVHWEEDNLSLDTGVKIATSEESLLTLDRTLHSFGDVPQKGGTVSTTVEVKNNGNDDLIIGDITTSCGCTTAEIDTKTITPGGTEIITVTFDPDFHEEPSGTLKRTVFIPSNDPENPEIEFKIEADIIEASG